MPTQNKRSQSPNVSYFRLSPKYNGITRTPPLNERHENSASISTSSGALSQYNQEVHSQVEALQFEIDLLKHQNKKLTQSISLSRKNSTGSPASSECEDMINPDQIIEPKGQICLKAIEAFFLGLFSAFLIFGLLYSLGLFHNGTEKKRLIIKNAKSKEYFTLNEELGFNSRLQIAGKVGEIVKLRSNHQINFPLNPQQLLFDNSFSSKEKKFKPNEKELLSSVKITQNGKHSKEEIEGKHYPKNTSPCPIDFFNRKIIK